MLDCKGQCLKTAPVPGEGNKMKIFVLMLNPAKMSEMSAMPLLMPTCQRLHFQMIKTADVFISAKVVGSPVTKQKPSLHFTFHCCMP